MTFDVNTYLIVTPEIPTLRSDKARRPSACEQPPKAALSES